MPGVDPVIWANQRIEQLEEELRRAREVLREAKEMLGVFEDNGGHDGMMGKAYLVVLDHIESALRGEGGEKK